MCCPSIPCSTKTTSLTSASSGISKLSLSRISRYCLCAAALGPPGVRGASVAASAGVAGRDSVAREAADPGRERERASPGGAGARVEANVYAAAPAPPPAASFPSLCLSSAIALIACRRAHRDWSPGWSVSLLCSSWNLRTSPPLPACESSRLMESDALDSSVAIDGAMRLPMMRIAYRNALPTSLSVCSSFLPSPTIILCARRSTSTAVRCSILPCSSCLGGGTFKRTRTRARTWRQPGERCRTTMPQASGASAGGLFWRERAFESEEHFPASLPPPLSSSGRE
mmetsp:Transcript_36222/g.114270  ORF Transcript_36222/g.114270 Transcript_36222/m.114270 type:complete len:285 (+) Transcript_36222:1934-2788(+)